MKTLTNLLVMVASACLSAVALGQDEPQTYIYSTYHYCDFAEQDEADKIVDSAYKPIYDAAVADGTIGGWGWLAHHTGGKWRRVNYHSAGSILDVIAAQESFTEKLYESGAMDKFADVCGSHDDYIWRGVTGSGGDILSTERGKVGLSAYYVCDSREATADEIVKTVIAPLYDAQVGDGKLTTWGWAEHIVGGKYRRLATMTAADWSSLFAAREAIIADLADSELASEFSDICDSHADYLWEIQYENP